MPARFLFVFLALVSCNPLASADDSQTSEWVTLALAQDQRIDNIKVHVDTADGIVTLTGQVPTIAAKDFASQEAGKIDGVTGVTNELTVDVEERSDDEIRRDIENRITHNASIVSRNITVGCLNGYVTLSGEVANYVEELEAEDIASEVRGVKQVQNHLLTAFIAKHTDEQIEKDVLATLIRDVYLNEYAVQVSVKKGVVTLSGNVGSAYAKIRATEEVKHIAHVKAVTNQIKVDPVLMRGEKTTNIWTTEEDLQAALETELAHDSRIDATNVTPSVEYGHVVLDGAVQSLREKRIAEQDAFDIIGVMSVANDLTVNPVKRDDVAIVEEVTTDFKADSLLHHFDIQAKSTSAAVTLTGTVDDFYQRAHAEQVASQVSGVAKVENKIKVQEADSPSDDKLKQLVVDRWSHNKITKPCKLIELEITGGVATLTGNVDSWAEHQEAARVAFHTNGVRQVKNHLVVEGFDYPWEQFRGEDGQPFDPSSPQVHSFLFD